MSSPSAGSPVGGGTPSTYTPLYNSSSMNNARFNPTMAVIIIVLIGGCFILGFVSVFVRRCMSGETAGTTATERSRTWNSKTGGLDKEAVEALPIVHSCDLDEKDDRECPVCLTEFEPEDSLRLLPTCKHIFHQECIDAWFDAHSTCPLCRASLTGVASTASGAPGASREPAVATVTEVSESGDSDIELQPTSAAATPREDSIRDSAQTSATMPAGAVISRQDSLNSARGTLSRNSHSFKRAARGTTALEKAHSLGAQFNKPPATPTASSRKPPLTPASTTPGIRRSSSSGPDLIALRNLLTGTDQNGNASYRLSAMAKSDAPSTSSSWFTRARSMDLSKRGRSLPRTQSSDNWVAIDLESGKAVAAPGASTSQGEPFTAPERSWSDRWSLASLRGAMFPLRRSTSDVTSRTDSPHLPV